MKLAPLFYLGVVTALAAAKGYHGSKVLSRRHEHISRLARRNNPFSRRCKVEHQLSKSGHATGGNHNTSSAGTFTGPTSGLINVASSCGPIGATVDVTPTSGPNGAIDWLNCGVNGDGWTPPFVRVTDIIATNLSEAISEPGSPFTACNAYLDTFEKYATEYDVPPILMTAIAMQESTCIAATVGGAGEQGLMQLTSDKCKNAPNGDCKDPDYNIRTGVKYFSETLRANGGSLLLTIGNYNGWPKGMTYSSATAAADTDCCTCQNNLDYLQQTLNGWVQNVNPYTSDPPIGKYFNLDVCHKS